MTDNAHRVPPEPFWQGVRDGGGDGFDSMDAARARRWEAIPVWGRDGWDLGDWPLVVIYTRHDAGGWYLAENVEGDVTVRSFPDEAQRTAAIDALAFDWWKYAESPHVAGYATVADLPGELRGPFSWARLDAEQRS
jgi:hypothetical protein